MKMAGLCKLLNMNKLQVLKHFVTTSQRQIQITTAVYKQHHVFAGLSHRFLRNQNKCLLYAHEVLCVRNDNCSSHNYKFKHDKVKAKTKKSGNIIAKFSEEIDLDALRKQGIKDFKEKGIPFDMAMTVKKILDEKCNEAILNLSAEDQKKLKTIQLEHDFMYSEGHLMPSFEEMTSENWLEALNLSSPNTRLRYYVFCMKRIILKRKVKAPPNPELASTEANESDEKVPVNDNKIMIRLLKSSMKRWDNHRLAASMQFGIPLVLDMDYTEFMDSRHAKNTASQVLDMYCLNRSDPQMPFHLHLTGCPPENSTYRLIQLLLQNDPHFMVSESPQSYLDLFDKERLVYLSPHGKQVMRRFDPNAVYIIGAYNDKATQKPISYSRAKEQGIKCQRLPLDQHLKWCIGSKALTLNQMLRIMQSVKNQDSWQDAFKAIPSRKLIMH